MPTTSAPTMIIPAVDTQTGEQRDLEVISPIGARYLDELPPRRYVALLDYGRDLVLQVLKPSLEIDRWLILQAYDWPREHVAAVLPTIVLPTTGVDVVVSL